MQTHIKYLTFADSESQEHRKPQKFLVQIGLEKWSRAVYPFAVGPCILFVWVVGSCTNHTSFNRTSSYKRSCHERRFLYIRQLIAEVFFQRHSCKARVRGQGATVLQVQVQGGTSKNWRGFVDKTEGRLEPGGVKLYSGVVYSSKDDLFMYPNCWQQEERKAKPIIAKPRANILETKS